MRLLKQLLISTVVTGFAISPALSAEFPSKPVTLVVPYGPGGGTDTIGRIIAGVLPTYLGQPVVVVNRPGATGTVGTADVARADADGYTMLLSDAASMSVKPQTTQLPYARDDFKVVASINKGTYLLSAPKDRPYKTLSEFIEYAEGHDPVTHATSGVGSPFHLAIAQMARTAGIDLTHVPTSGTGKAVTMALGGQVDAVMSYPNAVLTQIEAGQLVPLAVSSTERLEILPDVPTFIEAGVEYSGSGWKALFVRENVPEERRAVLEAAVLEMRSDATFIKLMTGLGETISVKAGAEFTPTWHEEYDQLGSLLTELGLKGG